MAAHKHPLGRRDFLKGAGTLVTLVATGGHAAGSLLTEASPRPNDAQSGASGRKVRIGVVGGGFGSSFQWHLDPNCKVTAYCDLREDRLDALTKAYGPAARYKNYREFLKHPELDAVAVFTPAPLHVWMATEAMKVGKHAISAVPAGMSVEELE